MIFDPALVTAKPPPPSPFSTLLHDISTAWADIYWHIIMPLGVMIFVPTCVTAKFLPRDMTRWLKRLPAVQALQYSPFFVCGTFFMAGLGVEDFVSLTENQIQRYKEHFDNRMVLTVPTQEGQGKNRSKKGKTHER